MRVMAIVKATKNSEAGVLPDEKLLTAMGKYNEELVKAGVMLAGEGLHPSSRGKRVKFGGGKKTVIDGPFAETKELIAGFWLWQVKSMEEAMEWLKRCPDPMPGEEGIIEVRPVFEAEDFGKEFTPELRKQEEELRRTLEARQRYACPRGGCLRGPGPSEPHLEPAVDLSSHLVRADQALKRGDQLTDQDRKQCHRISVP